MGDDIVYSLMKVKVQSSELRNTKYITRYIAGRQDSGGTWSVTINLTDDTIDEWETLISASTTAQDSGLATWFEVYSPHLTKAFFLTAEPPREIPMPDFAQNELATVEMTLTINEYIGMDTAVIPE